MTDEIPDIVVGRLPVYLRALNYMAEEPGKITTSSHELGQRLGISSAQIRKDLSHFGEFGKQGTGYHINYLIEQLRHILHLDQEWKVLLVGAGKLGSALANYQGWRDRGFQIKWIFDVDPEIVGREVNDMIVQDTNEIESVINRENVQIAILAVPASAAQAITDRLIDAGIKSILSYAPINLISGPEVHIRYSDPAIQLQTMTYYIDTE